MGFHTFITWTANLHKLFNRYPWFFLQRVNVKCFKLTVKVFNMTANLKSGVTVALSFALVQHACYWNIRKQSTHRSWLSRGLFCFLSSTTSPKQLLQHTQSVTEGTYITCMCKHSMGLSFWKWGKHGTHCLYLGAAYPRINTVIWGTLMCWKVCAHDLIFI